MAFRTNVLPAIPFATIIGIAAYSTFGQLYQSGLTNDINKLCPPTGYVSDELTPYQIAYTGSPGLDHALCGVISFFHSLFTPGPSIKFVNYFLINAAPLLVWQAVEAARSGRSAWVAYPGFYVLLGQSITFGVAFPLYCLLFVLSNGTETAGRGATFITQAHAEAIAFSIFIGFAIPSAGLTLLQDPQVTAIWQLFPIYIFIAQLGHLAFRSPKSYPQSGYWVIRIIYIATFIIGSSSHVATALPLMASDWGAFKKTFLPSLTALSSQSRIASRAHQILKLDLFFTNLPMLLLEFWLIEPSKAFTVLIWNLLVIPSLGPGAAFSGFALWRESIMRVEYEKTGRDKAKEKKEM